MSKLTEHNQKYSPFEFLHSYSIFLLPRLPTMQSGCLQFEIQASYAREVQLFFLPQILKSFTNDVLVTSCKYTPVCEISAL